MMQYCEPRNIILAKVSTRNTEVVGEWTAKLNTLKTQFWACELFFLFFYYRLLHWKFCFVLFTQRWDKFWIVKGKHSKPETLKYEKPICIKTSRKKNKSKSWKQVNNNIILEWQLKWKHTASVKKCWFLYTAKNLIHFPVISHLQCKIKQIIWIANNFQKIQRKGVFSRDLIVYLKFITSIWCL